MDVLVVNHATAATRTSPGRRPVILMTCAHRDHVPENIDPANLAAYCEGCHLHYDREHHAQTRGVRRVRALGLESLFTMFLRAVTLVISNLDGTITGRAVEVAMGSKLAMSEHLSRLGREILQLRNVDVYVIAAVAIVLAVLSVVSDVVPDDLRWAGLFAGIAVLVYRSAIPSQRQDLFESMAGDRSDYDSISLSDRWRNASEVWIFGPSAINVLSARNCDILRKSVFSKQNAVLRIVVLDPDSTNAVGLAARQLDDSLDFPMQDFRTSLDSSIKQLRLMRSWVVAGDLQYRLAEYNPGFSLVATDPSSQHGCIIIEYHGAHNETINSRMHIELTRSISPRWYSYWMSQFEHVWDEARVDASDLEAPPADQKSQDRSKDGGPAR